MLCLYWSPTVNPAMVAPTLNPRQICHYLLWGGKKQRRNECELNLFTILQTWWNLELQTGTKQQLLTENRCETCQKRWVYKCLLLAVGTHWNVFASLGFNTNSPCISVTNLQFLDQTRLFLQLNTAVIEREKQAVTQETAHTYSSKNQHLSACSQGSSVSPKMPVFWIL